MEVEHNTRKSRSDKWKKKVLDFSNEVGKHADYEPIRLENEDGYVEAGAGHFKLGIKKKF